MVWYFDMYKAKIATLSYKIFNWKTPSCLEHQSRGERTSFASSPSCECFAFRNLLHEEHHLIPASYPDVSLSRWKSAHKGRREGGKGLRLPSVPFPWSLVVHHQSLVSSLRKTKRLRRRLISYRGSFAWNLLDPPVASARAYAKRAINSQALN